MYKDDTDDLIKMWKKRNVDLIVRDEGAILELKSADLDFHVDVWIYEESLSIQNFNCDSYSILDFEFFFLLTLTVIYFKNLYYLFYR